MTHGMVIQCMLWGALVAVPEVLTPEYGTSPSLRNVGWEAKEGRVAAGSGTARKAYTVSLRLPSPAMIGARLVFGEEVNGDPCASRMSCW